MKASGRVTEHGGQESGQGHVRAMSTRQGLGRIKGYVRVQDSGW